MLNISRIMLGNDFLRYFSFRTGCSEDIPAFAWTLQVLQVSVMCHKLGGVSAQLKSNSLVFLLWNMKSQLSITLDFTNLEFVAVSLKFAFIFVRKNGK